MLASGLVRVNFSPDGRNVAATNDGGKGGNQAMAARRAGAGGCLLDTAVKDGRGLFEWLTPEALAELVADGHTAGLEMALAGALRAEELDLVRATGADIAGVRSAACRDGRRTAPLDAARIGRLRAECES